MKVLGVESSCDETSASVVCDDSMPERRILSNVIYSQIALHAKYGGVVPEVAARQHAEVIDVVINEALEKANCTLDEIDVIAATAGPGLIGGLLVGTVCAKTISAITNKPFMAINLLTSRLCYDAEFPFLSLITSGGHFFFAEACGVGKYKILGETLDDAAGECFDKVARMLGFGYPGGVAIQSHAEMGDTERFKFPLPLQRRPGCDASFSGLKTAVKTCVEKIQNITEQDKCDIAASFQHIVVKFVTKQFEKALEMCSASPKSIVVSGGVASNKALRNSLMDFAHKHNLRFLTPPVSLCSDNAAMIAWTAIERIKSGYPYSPLDAKNLPRWKITEI